MTFTEMKDNYPQVAELFVKSSLDLQYPGGESLMEMAKRVNTFPDKLSGTAPDETILVVSHRGPLRVLICHLLGMDFVC